MDQRETVKRKWKRGEPMKLNKRGTMWAYCVGKSWDIVGDERGGGLGQPHRAILRVSARMMRKMLALTPEE